MVRRRGGAALFIVPKSIRWFQPASWPDGALLGFWLADGMLVVGGSLATAFMVLKRLPHSGIAIWMLAATTWYPTLYCIGVSTLTGEAWLASGLMSCMAGLTLSMATIHGTDHQSPAMFRVGTMIKTMAVVWTFTQLVIFWGVFLWVLPMAILELEERLGWLGSCILSRTRFQWRLLLRHPRLVCGVPGQWRLVAKGLRYRPPQLPSW